MKRSRANLFAAVCFAAVPVAAASIAAMPAHAQAQAEPDPPQRIEEVITVTATRLPVSLSDLPVAARRWTAENLQTAPAIFVDDIVRRAPAASLFRRTSSRDSHPTTQGLNLRGIAPSGVGRSLVLVDGVPMNDPFGGWVYWDRVPLLAIEQVEVALGGGSAPYGSQALGGVLQLVTRERPDTPLEMQVLGGTDATVRFGIASGGGFSGGSVFASAQVFSTGGYIPTAPAERGTADEEITSSNQAVRLRVDLNSGLTFTVDGLREARRNGTPGQRNDTEYGGFSAAWNGVGDGGNAGWHAYGLARTQEFNSTFAAVAADRNSDRVVLFQTVPSTDFGAGGHGWYAPGAHRVSFGGDWRRVRGRSEELVTFNNSTRRPGGTQHSGGGFVGLDMPATSTLHLSAGVRADGWRQTPSQDTTGDARGASALSPRIGLAYAPRPGFTLRASGYGAFRAPTLNELYRQFRVGNVITTANAELEKERLWGAEAGGGWSHALGDGVDVSFGGTYYWNRLDDAVINATMRTTPTLVFRQRQNLGAATARGVELDAQLDIGSTWSLRFDYSWLNAFIREAVPGTDPAATVGNRLPQVPPYRARGTLWYRNPSDWAASFNVAAAGEQFEDDLNQLPLASTVTAGAAVEIPLMRSLRATLRAENLFDENVEVRRAPVLSYGAPRLIYLGFTLGWPQ